MSTNLQKYLRDFSDYPKKGVTFKDIAPLLRDVEAFRFVITRMRDMWEGRVDMIVGLDARGFIFGSTLAYDMGVPFTMVRKKGKLPGEIFECAYDLEYGEAVLSLQIDACMDHARILIVDDLLATGGTAQAACTLIKRAGATVAGCAFVIELVGLNGRNKLSGHDIQSLIMCEEA